MPNINSLRNFKMDKELCKTCGKLIPKTNFACHLKSHSFDTFVHQDTKIPEQFSCITCKKRFQSKELAEKHILTCNFCCGICQKSFKQKQTLTRHVKTVHNQLKPTIKCDDCQEEFDKKGDLKEHIKSHTPLNSKIIYGKRKREVSSMSGVIKRANLQCPNFI